MASGRGGRVLRVPRVVAACGRPLRTAAAQPSTRRRTSARPRSGRSSSGGRCPPDVVAVALEVDVDSGAGRRPCCGGARRGRTGRRFAPSTRQAGAARRSSGARARTRRAAARWSTTTRRQNSTRRGSTVPATLGRPHSATRRWRVLVMGSRSTRSRRRQLNPPSGCDGRRSAAGRRVAHGGRVRPIAADPFTCGI